MAIDYQPMKRCAIANTATAIAMVSMKVRLTGLINQSPQYAIDQSRVSVFFVNTRKDWSYCATRLLQAQIMGFDTETRPTWGKQQRRNPCALLQIAVRDANQTEEVFVLDLLHLSAKVYNSTLTSVFLSKTIVKLGQSFYQDLQELAQAYPHASCFTVCKNVVEVNDLSISLTGAHNPLSLQKLVFFYLHRKLSKTQQLSNWARRPLTPGQLHYAAADALVLIHLYDELLMRLQKHQKSSFQLSDIANVLDVNLPLAPKCSLCFESFESKAELKNHRQTCALDVRTLVICGVCEGKKIVTEKVMKHHVKHCGVEDTADEPIVQVKRKRSMSVENQTQQTSATGSKKRRLGTTEAKSEQVKTPEDVNMETAANTRQELKKALTKRQKKKRKAQALAAQLGESEQVKTPEDVSVETAANTKQELKKALTKRQKKKRKAQALAAQLGADGIASQTAETTKQQKKRNNKKEKKKQAKALAALKAQLGVGGIASQKTETSSCRDQEYKKRKMSMELSLLASDAMWSQISSDCESFTAAT